MARVSVVGAGVVGLSCAVRLLEAGHRVDVLARDLPRETVSAVAAAIWYPYRAFPQERVLRWSTTTYVELGRLAGQGVPGVVVRTGTEVHTEPRPDDPWWAEAVPDLERVRPVPTPFVDAWSFAAPVVDPGTYLPWLRGRVEQLGGTMTRISLAALPVLREGGLVVNCSGLGARLLAADHEVTPVRGQVVRLEQWGQERWWLEGEGPTYVVPREHDVVVGGTAEEGEWSRSPSARTTAELLRRAARLVPEVARARVLGTAVGLRPARPAVRLEREGGVVHCYGHGGAGFTVSWGCAEEVVRLVEQPQADLGAPGEPGSTSS